MFELLRRKKKRSGGFVRTRPAIWGWLKCCGSRFSFGTGLRGAFRASNPEQIGDLLEIRAPTRRRRISTPPGIAKPIVSPT